MVVGLVVAGIALHTGAKSYFARYRGREFAQFLQPANPTGRQLQERPPVVVHGKVSHDAKEVDRKLALSLGSLGLVTSGIILYPPLALLSIPGLVYLSLSFIQTGYHNVVKERRVGIAVIDAVSATLMLLLGYFFADALFFVLYYLSSKLLLKTQDSSKANLVCRFGEQRRFIWVQQGDVEIEMPIEKLAVGDIVVVNAGETIAVDGTIVDGFASIDQRLLTGESQPAEKGKGESVFASTTVLSGRLYIQVDHTGSETVAAQISDILSRTVDFKSSGEWQGEHLADKSALPMLALSALTLPLLGPGSAVAILNAYFGYNLRLISPISVLNFLSIASQEGILVKDGQALEVLSQVDTIVFDKTGTLTLEQPHIGQIYTWTDIAEEEILAYAAAAESKQTHPIARAIRQEATSRELLVPEIDQASYEVGYGVKTSVADRVIRVGSIRFMEMEGLAIPSRAKTTQTYCHEHGYALVYVAIGDQLVGGIELHATIRPEAKRVISDLRQRNMSVYIISGDHEKPTQQLAQELAVDHYFAETLPEQKAELIAQLQHEGRSVCFVGDGINDAIALTTADVSISLSGASALAIDAAQIILLDARLNQVTRLFELAKHLDANMKSNLITTVIPGVACIGGVYLLKFGVIATEVLYNLGLVAGVTNAMLPALKYERQQQEPHTA